MADIRGFAGTDAAGGVAMALTIRPMWRLVCRSLLVQTPLNYRTMQGTGYLFTLWPWLKRRSDREHSADVASGFMNSHPVLSTLAAGALLKRIEDGDAERDAADVGQWQSEISGLLGMAGDALIWDRWKPLVFALGALVLLWSPRIETWIAVAAASLLLYNIPLLSLRCWGARTGYRLGARVMESLADPRFSTWRRWLGLGGAILAGFWLGSLLICSAVKGPIHAAQALAAFAVAAITIRRQWTVLWTTLAAMAAAAAISLLFS
ncbi:MAG: PTS system mannose/fructose/sorbose family transporter subunit IID [bacterium]|nr:PTS system mannose/fructose/sorbose family transporter subunit IID [bacterium]